MRKKVRKSLAFLLALALVVSVMSGLGLSVSAEQESNTPGTEEVQQQDKTEAGAAPSEVKAEEEAAKPEEKPVQEEKADEQKTEAKENADKPAEKQEKATPKAGENVQTATIGTGDKTVTVKTTAAAGVLPEGAKLLRMLTVQESGWTATAHRETMYSQRVSMFIPTTQTLP